MGIKIPETSGTWLSREKSSLMFVGRLVPKKGVGLLLEAAGLLHKQGVQFQLTLAGGGEDFEKYKAQGMDLGLAQVVRFLGPIPHKDVYAEMSRHQICIVPSQEAKDGDQEGLGLTVLEALACGSHVIASDISVFRELLGEEKGAHTFFIAGSALDLSKRLRQKLEDVVCAENTKHFRVDEFAWAAVATRYKEAFERLLVSRPRTRH